MRLPLSLLYLVFVWTEVAAQTPTPVPSTVTPSELLSNVPSDVPSSVPTVAVAAAPPTQASTCYSNLTIVFEVNEIASQFDQKVFTLCPNTVFDIGYTIDAECCFEGQMPLLLRSNTLVKCGEDGKSSNNCTMKGGESHILTSRGIWDEDVFNVEIQGLTFDGPTSLTYLLAAKGDITFTDCIIKVGNH